MSSGNIFPKGTNLFDILPDSKPVIKNNNYSAYIQLLDKNVYVPTDNLNIVISGTVILKFYRNCHISNITLTFNGSFELYWPEGLINSRTGKKIYHEEHDLINIDYFLFGKNNNSLPDLFVPLNLLTSVNANRRYPDSVITNNTNNNKLKSSFCNGMVFEKGRQYVFSFQYIIPNDKERKHCLPDSIRTDYGICKYQLTLTMIYSNESNDKNTDYDKGILIGDDKRTKKSKRSGFLSFLLSSRSQKAAIGNLPLTLVHIPTNIITDDLDSIHIFNTWKDSLFYEINIGNRNILLDAYLPLSIHFIPTNKMIVLNRINVFLEERLQFNSLVDSNIHRKGNIKKYLLLQHSEAKSGNLLSSLYGDIENKYFQYEMFVPYCLNSYKKVHPDQIINSYVEVLHWLKFELTVIFQGKIYEIVIDTPITVLNKLCSNSNLLLPRYNDVVSNQYLRSAPSLAFFSPNINRFFPFEVITSNTITDKLSANDIIIPSMVLAGKTNKRIKNKVNNAKRCSLPLINSSKLINNIYQPINLSYDLTTAQAMPKVNVNYASSFVESQNRDNYIKDSVISPPSYEELFNNENDGSSNVPSTNITTTVIGNIGSNILKDLNKFEFNYKKSDKNIDKNDIHIQNNKFEVIEQDLSTSHINDSWIPKSLIN